MTRSRVISLIAGLLVATGIGLAFASRDRADWDPGLLLLLTGMVLVADLIPIESGKTKISLSGSFLGLIVAMALVGPAPAAAVAFVSVVVDGIRAKPRAPIFLANVAGFVLFPLAGGWGMHVLGDYFSVGIDDPEWLLVMVPGFVIASFVNCAIVFSAMRLLDGGTIRSRVKSLVIPLIPSEMAMLLIAAIVIYAETQVGPMALVALIGVLLLYLWLYRELMISQDRGEELVLRNDQLSALQVGILTTMLRTLALRDHKTARHSAAVARYARELAIAYGCSDDDVQLVHTAGLLHDIGKFIFPDRILLADRKLSDEDWEIVRCHPFQGAKVVRQVEGHEPVADVILAHHERVDGKGYPRGLKDDEIPLLSRMISVCDTYDVMTARDSYRDPVSAELAIEELERVSGSQLDGDLVEVFVRLVRGRGLAFQHADDADFESELEFDRRVHDYADDVAEAEAEAEAAARAADGDGDSSARELQEDEAAA